MSPVERLGIFGGTFDPIHNGHLAVVCDARHEARLDRILIVPAGAPWQKEVTVVASAQQRWEMCVLATKDHPWLEVSRIEVDREGLSYTIDTLRELAAPDRHLVLVVGIDIAAGIYEWERGEEIREMCQAGAVSMYVTDRWYGLSSTDIRERVVGGRPLDFIVPDAVRDYVMQTGVYS